MSVEEEISPDTGEITAEKDISIPAKLAAVVLDPKKLFRAVAARPRWVPPVLVLMGVALVFAFLTRPVIIEEMGTGKQMERVIEQRNLSDEEAARAIELQKGIAKWGILVSAPLTEVVTVVVMAVILLFVGNVLMGGSAAFVAILSAYAWARLINVLGYAAKIPLILHTKSIQVTLSPAILLPTNASDSLFYAVLSVFDIFHVWEAVLTCIAMAAVYKISLQRSVGFVGTLYVVLAAVGILLRELFHTGGV